MTEISSPIFRFVNFQKQSPPQAWLPGHFAENRSEVP
jgi:hypothetical protein